MQTLHRYFGLEIRIAKIVPESVKAAFRPAIVRSVSLLTTEQRANLRVFISHITFRWHKRRFATALDNRIARLSLDLHPLTTAGYRVIAFHNHMLGPRKIADVQVKDSLRSIQYGLDRAYLSSHEEFSDYIATLVPATSRLKDRRLEVLASAAATPDHSNVVLNVASPPVTKAVLPLHTGTEIILPPDTQAPASATREPAR